MRSAVDLRPWRIFFFEKRREIRDGAHFIRGERYDVRVVRAADVPNASLFFDVVVAAHTVRDRGRAGADADEAADGCARRDSGAVAALDADVAAADGPGEAAAALDLRDGVRVLDRRLAADVRGEAAAFGVRRLHRPAREAFADAAARDEARETARLDAADVSGGEGTRNLRIRRASDESAGISAVGARIVAVNIRAERRASTHFRGDDFARERAAVFERNDLRADEPDVLHVRLLQPREESAERARHA